MYKEITFSTFCDAFSNMNRNDNFTYEGKQALFEYLEDYENSTGEKQELDIIALCCEYTEYKDLKELQNNYGSIEDMEDLENSTFVIHIENSDGFIIQDF